MSRPIHRPACRRRSISRLGLNAPATGACCSAPLADNLQFWSDGQHNNGTLALNGLVALAASNSFDSISAGLLDNVTRQAPGEIGSPYALIVVPIWKHTAPQTSGTVGIIGFAQMKLLRSDISATHATGIFVPFPVWPAC